MTDKSKLAVVAEHPKGTKRLKAAERRRLILDAAQSILASDGFVALTLRNAAKASNIRLSTLQYYFATREILFEAAFQDIADRTWDDILLLIEDEKAHTPSQRLAQFIEGLAVSIDNDQLTGLFVELWAAARTNEFASRIMERYYDDAIALLAKLIKEAQPEVSSRESKRRATLILCSLEGLALFRQMERRKGGRATVPRGAVAITLMTLAETDTTR